MAAVPDKPVTAKEKPAVNKNKKPPRKTIKTRRDSVLDGDMLLPAPVDLRSSAERIRDKEMQLHFSRLAQLDVIEEIANQRDDTKMAEWCEQVRRNEVQRHQKVMIAMKRAAMNARIITTGVDQ
ncbi:MAG: hypothetical protein JW841_17155 [Deltaproteobacteria bacterium]|nr:hypothetical protein [Deltaproteobacteria bacterium]